VEVTNHITRVNTVITTAHAHQVLENTMMTKNEVTMAATITVPGNSSVIIE